MKSKENTEDYEQGRRISLDYALTNCMSLISAETKMEILRNYSIWKELIPVEFRDVVYLAIKNSNEPRSNIR